MDGCLIGTRVRCFMLGLGSRPLLSSEALTVDRRELYAMPRSLLPSNWRLVAFTFYLIIAESKFRCSRNG